MEFVHAMMATKAVHVTKLGNLVQTINCSNHGTCNENGVCDCNPGFSGLNCAISDTVYFCSSLGGIYGYNVNTQDVELLPNTSELHFADITHVANTLYCVTGFLEFRWWNIHV